MLPQLGYLNRNYIEELNVPIGPDNFINMAGVDQRQRQPTYFHARSNRDIFTVNVPADFGDREIVWSLNTQGKTLQAIGWLQAACAHICSNLLSANFHMPEESLAKEAWT